MLKLFRLLSLALMVLLLPAVSVQAAVVETLYTDDATAHADGARYFQVRNTDDFAGSYYEVQRVHTDSFGQGILDERANMTHTNGLAQDFSLDYDSSAHTLTFSIAGVSMTHNIATSIAYDQVYIQAQSRGSSRTDYTQTTIADLAFNGVVLNNSTLVHTQPGSFTPASGLLLTGEIFSGSDFSLTGNMTFDWPEGDSLSGGLMNLEAGMSSSVVPIPAAVWLFGSALAGLGWMKRKQVT